ncbi:Extracellular solute-binding protein, family 3 [Thiocapsa sp. KS1]|nr:transporter substrate-binding domain-containing protein [Thiocapsa sp. KS1]CRI65744.1 Extracellular solute-binding protein, family 3 [Thiocapsa sp. KS1]
MNDLSKGLALVCALALAGLSAPGWCGDLDEIRERGELRHLGIKYANFVTGSGDGFDVELVKGFADELGVRYVLVETNFYHVIRDLLGKDVVRSGSEVKLEGDYPVRGDMIAAGFTVLPWREQVLLYSQPTFPSQVLLVARSESELSPISGSDDLSRDILQTKAMIGAKSLLVMERTCLDPANYGLTGAGIDLKSYTRSSNLNEMVPALLNNEAELTLLDVPDAILDLKKWAGTIKVIGPISEHQNLAAAFPKDAPELRDAFDDYLARLKADGTYDRLVDKYYPGIRRYFPAFFNRDS